MTRSPTPVDPHDPITEEAIAWFVRTHSDQRTLVDEDRFAQWLKQDPEHARAYERVERVWRAAGPQITPRPLESERRSSRLGRSPRGWWAITSIAAALAMLVIGASYVLNTSAQVSNGTFATGIGEQRELELSDGSVITLNTRSEVAVDLREEQRIVRLLRGEARFKVAKDAERPFIVDAGGARVRALGTAFDVRLEGGRVAVTLVEGRVEVTPTLANIQIPEPAVLMPGQQLSLELESGEQRIEPVDVKQASAWMREQLIFDSEPLPLAVEEANRYLTVPIAIEDPTLAEIRISGVVRAGNAEAFVRSLESSFPIAAVEHPDGRIVLMRRPSEPTR
jgi:transmembrane sensor